MPEHPKIHMIRLRIGLCLGTLGRFAQAEKHFEPAFRAIDSNNIFNDEARTASRARDHHDQARR